MKRIFNFINNFKLFGPGYEHEVDRKQPAFTVVPARGNDLTCYAYNIRGQSGHSGTRNWTSGYNVGHSRTFWDIRKLSIIGNVNA